MAISKINLSLIGKNITYKELCKPKKVAYPEGNEVIYEDDYIRELNAKYSLEQVLGTKIERIAKYDHFAIASIVMGSPLQNSEGEDALAYILTASALARKWQPFIINVPKLKDTSIKTSDEYLSEVKSINDDYNTGRIEAGILFGVARASRVELVVPTSYENKLVVIPSQEGIEYFASRKKD